MFKIKEQKNNWEINKTIKLCGKSSYKKSAFTLAEVLITIGIIGIVSVITLPIVIANRRAKILETQFKKHYNELNQALLLLKKDDITIYGNYTADGTSEINIGNLLISTFKNAKKGNNGKYLDNIYKTYDKQNYISRNFIDDGMIIVNNGDFFIFINNDNYNLNDIEFIIDINGNKKPNIVGYDLFCFALTKGDKLAPNLYKACTGSQIGTILSDPNYFKNLKW